MHIKTTVILDTEVDAIIPVEKFIKSLNEQSIANRFQILLSIYNSFNAKDIDQLTEIQINQIKNSIENICMVFGIEIQQNIKHKNQ